MTYLKDFRLAREKLMDEHGMSYKDAEAWLISHIPVYLIRDNSGCHITINSEAGKKLKLFLTPHGYALIKAMEAKK